MTESQILAEVRCIVQDAQISKERISALLNRLRSEGLSEHSLFYKSLERAENKVLESNTYLDVSLKTATEAYFNSIKDNHKDVKVLEFVEDSSKNLSRSLYTLQCILSREEYDDFIPSEVRLTGF